jgi:DnaK suppressor protein
MRSRSRLVIRRRRGRATPANEWGEPVDDDRARALLKAERSRVERLLAETDAAGQDDRAEANAQGDMSDPAERQVAEESDDTVSSSLRERLEAIGRAERRLDDGTFGRSVRSGLPIPEERLEADPAAELTVEEAREG